MKRRYEGFRVLRAIAFFAVVGALLFGMRAPSGPALSEGHDRGPVALAKIDCEAAGNRPPTSRRTHDACALCSLCAQYGAERVFLTCASGVVGIARGGAIRAPRPHFAAMRLSDPISGNLFFARAPPAHA